MTNREIIADRVAAFADPSRRAYYLDLYADEAQLHGYEGVGPGKPGIAAFYDAMWKAFPDARVEVQDVLEDGDRVIARFQLFGTHKGEYLGVPATGKPIQTHGITILKMKDGKCVERWSAADFLCVMAQLGAFPPPR